MDVRSLFIAILFVMGASSISVAETLRFSYWDDATPPFIIESEDTAVGGIIYDLAKEISQDLNADHRLVKLPVPRIEPQLEEGKVDLDCITSPIWKNKPDAYHWSPILFNASDNFLIRRELNSYIKDISDLEGKTLGIYKGYVYHPDIMNLIAAGKVNTIKVKGVEHGIQLLKLNRIDALIDFGILLQYQIKTKNLAPQFMLADLPADSYDLHCAYSKKVTVDPAKVDAAISEIVRSGRLEKILEQYR